MVQGILPLDSQQILIEARGQKYIDVDLSESLDWAPVRERVKKGIRNSNIMAIAPTATISNIVGVSQSIEPTYQNLYVKSNLSGEFTVINPYGPRPQGPRPVGPGHGQHLKYYDGSVQQIERIPQDLKDMYATAFEVETKRGSSTLPAAARSGSTGAVAEPVHRRRLGQEARRDLPHGLVPWPENHLLPPCPARPAPSPPSTPAS